MKLIRALCATAALCLVAPLAMAQQYQDSGGTAVPGFVPIQPGVGPLFTTGNPGKISGSFSATLNGFTPTSPSAIATIIAADALTHQTALPSGADVKIENTLSTAAYCVLGINSSVTATSTTAEIIPPFSSRAAHINGSSWTNVACIAQSPATSEAITIIGGTGLAVDTGGGGGGGGSSGANVSTTGGSVPGSAGLTGYGVGGVFTGATGTANGLNVDASHATLTVANPAVGTTGAANPGSQVSVGGDANGLIQPIQQTATSVAINISTATTTQLIALSSGKSIYITAWDVLAAGTGNITLEYGTGTNCGTGTTALTGAYNLVAQSGIAKGTGLGAIYVIPASNALCALTSAAAQMSGSVSYSQY